MTPQAYVVTGEKTGARSAAFSFLADTYGLAQEGNPDLIVREYGLFSVGDARDIASLASLTPAVGDTKAIVLTMDRIYREAQNALLKLLEEPPAGTVIVLAVPQYAMLLPTVRSRVQLLMLETQANSTISDDAHAFIAATKEKRTTLIKKLATGKDEDARRANRDAAIRILDGVEIAAYAAYQKEQHGARRNALRTTLSDIEQLRGYLYDRAAPVRMILEHLSIVLPQL